MQIVANASGLSQPWQSGARSRASHMVFTTAAVLDSRLSFVHHRNYAPAKTQPAGTCRNTRMSSVFFFVV